MREPLLRHCLCWNEVRTGSMASGVMTLTLSFVQILLQIAIWTGNGNGDMADYSPYVVYIPLAALDFLFIIFSVMLIVGVERDYKGRHLLLPWVVHMIIYLIYEACINIYFFAKTFPWAYDLNDGSFLSHTKKSPLLDDSNVLAQLVVVVVYWVLKFLLYAKYWVCNDRTVQYGVFWGYIIVVADISATALFCVVSRYQEMTHHRRRFTRNYLSDSFDFPPQERAMPRPRQYIREDRHYRDSYRDIPPIHVTQPPRYPHEREERHRQEHRRPNVVNGFLEAKRPEPYSTAQTPYPVTPKIYPQPEQPRLEEKAYYNSRY